MGKANDAVPRIDLLHRGAASPRLCRATFGTVRTTERQRAWTLEALVRFWAVVVRAPVALTQALQDDQRDPLFSRRGQPRPSSSAVAICGRPSSRRSLPGCGCGPRATRRPSAVYARFAAVVVVDDGDCPSPQAALAGSAGGPARGGVRRVWGGASVGTCGSRPMPASCARPRRRWRPCPPTRSSWAIGPSATLCSSRTCSDGCWGVIRRNW